MSQQVEQIAGWGIIPAFALIWELSKASCSLVLSVLPVGEEMADNLVVRGLWHSS